MFVGRASGRAAAAPCLISSSLFCLLMHPSRPRPSGGGGLRWCVGGRGRGTEKKRIPRTTSGAWAESRQQLDRRRRRRRRRIMSRLHEKIPDSGRAGQSMANGRRPAAATHAMTHPHNSESAQLTSRSAAGGPRSTTSHATTVTRSSCVFQGMEEV